MVGSGSRVCGGGGGCIACDAMAGAGQTGRFESNKSFSTRKSAAGGGVT